MVRREEGSAFVLALFVLLVASIAMALVAADASLLARSMIEQSERVQVRALVDAGLADSLARLADQPHSRGREFDLFDGRVETLIRRRGSSRRTVEVVAFYRDRAEAAVAEVLLDDVLPPRVTRWERIRPPERRAGG